MAENRRACASCGTANEEDARFCEGCGASLARVCATCGVEASATARFCRGCGAPLGGQSATARDVSDVGPARKTVTVMFADLAGSTSFEERVDAETAREVIGRYHELLRSTAQRHRAGVTKYIGDGFMAVWGVPEIGPDDAAHAVDAGVELQERFIDLAAHVAEIHGVELALRVAVNTGEVVVGAGDADLVGDALNVGARLEAECPRGRVVVGEETWRSTRGRYGYESLGEVHVKGRTAPVAVYQWLGRQTEAADATPFVGRSDEVGRLQSVLDDAVSARHARLVTVIGDPGVGKSRLAAQFTETNDGIRAISARCVLEGTVALAPIVEVLRARDLESDIPAGVSERDRLLRDLNGLVAGDAGSVEENFWALRRYVEVLAAAQPVLLVLDDIQWADTLLLDFIEHLVEWVAEVPVLVLALARPELREIRPDLVTIGRWVSAAVHLGGLDAGATAELATKVLGGAGLPDDLLRRLPSSTGGNPLFVRELIGMLAHDGVLVEQPNGWRLTIDVDAIAIPPTIHALLASRLERLDGTDRRVLEVASVVGSDFSLGAVRALTGMSADGVGLSLKRLRRLELAQPSGAYVGDEPVWRFHHVLIQDVAYRRLLKSDRAELHERLADWVAAGGASVAFDPDEMIGRHLEAAHTYRRELGTSDEHTADLAIRAARHYSASARRALDRDELVSAGTQAARGATLATADPAMHAELLLVGCEAFLSAGDVAAGAPLVDELERIADEALSPWATCYRCQFIVYTNPEQLLDAEARLQGAIDEFGRRGDHAGLAKAHRVRASARSRLGRIGDCESDLFEALIAARQSGDHRQITAALGAAPGAALWGPSPVPKAGGRCLDVVRMQRMTTAAPSLEATSLRCLAVLELLRGRPDKARTMLADARQVVADLGLRHGLMETELFAGIIESMEGDPVAAEPHFRTALEGLDALGVGADAGQAAALLAKSVLAQGRIDEADRYATESERLAGRNLKTAIAWRAVRAEILSAQGDHDEAIAKARDAVAVAAGTDLVLDHADACLALSRVLAAAGDAKGARSARDDADRLFAAKEVAGAIGRAAPDVAPASPPPAPKPATPSRLAVVNRASETAVAVGAALNAGNVDAAIALYSPKYVKDDRRRLSGDPIEGLTEARAALERVSAQYNRFDIRILAVRGECLVLGSSRWSDDAGNESTDLILFDVDADGRIAYEGRFDEDFDAAYRELDRRYYIGEGAAYAENGLPATEALRALDSNDFDRLFGEFSVAELRVESRSRRAFPDRSASDLRASFMDLDSMVASRRSWLSVVHWLSPSWSVIRMEREAVGQGGELYTWTIVIVSEHRQGRFVSMAEFDLDDEAAAFAYARERMRKTTSRLVVSNQSCELLATFIEAARHHDLDGAMAVYSDRFVYVDRRHLSGDPVVGVDAMRQAVARVFDQFTRLEVNVLAVRAQRVHLHLGRWSDGNGNQSNSLDVVETDGDGHIVYHGRFDEDDFTTALIELDRRYYASEGATFAQAGETITEWTAALNTADFDRLFGELTAPDFVIKNRSRSAFPDRSAAEYRTTLEQLAAMVVSSRNWSPTLSWVSPTCTVARCERDAVGADGARFSWSFVIVFEIRDGQVASMCEFELDDEEAAFTYAEELARPTTSRLAVRNRASEIADAAWRGLQAHDPTAVVGGQTEPFIYDDRRRLSGAPIENRAELLSASERILEQYPHTEWRTLAVRGETLELRWQHIWDDAGNEATTLNVLEIDEQLVYFGRFDEDDFDGAYRVLEERYFAGEGAAFADAGAVGTDFMTCLNTGDFERAFSELTSPDLVLENRSRSAFPDRSMADFRTTVEALDAMVISSRLWNSAIECLSPNVTVARQVREAVGKDGEEFTWSRLIVCEVRGGRFTSMCQFDLDDEDAAFAYAEARMRQTTSRLAVTNRSSEVVTAMTQALRAGDIDAVMNCCSDRIVYDDRRRLSGDLIEDTVEFRNAFTRVFEQYNRFDFRILAVRGDRLNLQWTRWSDDSGNQSSYLHVLEIGDDGKLRYDARFDEDDFEGAYRELERRYYAGEGAAFAESGAISTETFVALSRADYDHVFDDLVAPEMRVENRSRSAFGDRSTGDLRKSWRVLDAMIASSRMWPSAVCWLSPQWSVSRVEREGVGHDGELYTWTFVLVAQIMDGRTAALCQFDLDDEDSAFAYAEDRMRAPTSRLAVTNRAKEIIDLAWRALQAHNVDEAVASYADRFEYDDRRRLAGAPVKSTAEMHAASSRIVEQYPHLDWRTLAVRGTRLEMHSSRWRDEAGNETTGLHVFEIDEDDKVTYHGRFDEDDFEGAYCELERRYYAREGAAYAESGPTLTNYIVALNRGDLDRAFQELAAPGAQIESRSRSVFGDRSVTEFRASVDELSALIASQRTWNPVVHWLSPNWAVFRAEREAVGHDGEKYTWTRAYAIDIRDGRAVSLCEFEVEDEDEAFTYAEERMREATSRLAVRNLASQTTEALSIAMNAGDLDATLAYFSDEGVYEDNRRLSGDPIRDTAGLRAAAERILAQYSNFELQVLAVRGERLVLTRGRWSNDGGYETTHLAVREVDDEGLLIFEGRFDEDDFEGAYRELERRYYAGEGRAFAQLGAMVTDYLMAYNNGDFDQFLGHLTDPEMRFENRSRSVFGDRSVSELRSSIEELSSMVSTAQTWYSTIQWLSPTCCISRFEREATGEDNEKYSWSRIYVTGFRDGRAASSCQFDLDDEAAAFAYAEELIGAPASRLAVTNTASETAESAYMALRDHDVDGVLAAYADQFVSEDRRHLGGGSVDDVGALRTAMTELMSQYGHNEWRVLAVRGDRLALLWTRCWADNGFETTHLHVHEVGDDGRIVYEGRFDADDFVGAYRALEQRYYAGEGSAFAVAGANSTDFAVALNEGDLDRLFTELATPDFQLLNRSRSVFGDRSEAGFRATEAELNAMVASVRSWHAAVSWLSPTVNVGLNLREAVGHDGERYAWRRLFVAEIRDGRTALVCEFEHDDEEGAFAYADERVRASCSRLVVSNRASQTALALGRAMSDGDRVGTLDCFSDSFTYDDRRRLSGNPLRGKADLYTVVEQILAQYSRFDSRVLAVRGDRLELDRGRWSNESGFETVHLSVNEVDNDGRIVCQVRFDGDDFVAAYRELDRRYYAGEGAASAEQGHNLTEWQIALNERDFDRLFNELTSGDLQVENRSTSVFGDRSAAELRASIEQLDAMVSSAQSWHSVLTWLSPNWAIARIEREAVGVNGEQYAWSWLDVYEFRDKLMSVRRFEVGDEREAFTYAEVQVRSKTSRLAVRNRSCDAADAMVNALRTRDVDGLMAKVTDRFVYEDRRRLGGTPINTRADMRAAVQRIVDQYNHFEWRVLAVRGDLVSLHASRWWDDAGNETGYLHVYEFDEDGVAIYEGRFDADDFDGAYRELDQRYYRGEGAAFADSGYTITEYLIALNQGDFERAFGEHTTTDFHLENRSQSIFGDRTAAEFRAGQEELHAMVNSLRSWNSAMCWLSPAVGVTRFEREGTGGDGERYTWSCIVALEVRGRRLERLCQFELDDEDAAFAYAEERVGEASSRLPLTNLASRVFHHGTRFLQLRDIDAAAACYADDFVYDDQRRLGGNPIGDVRSAQERMLAQYNHFEGRTLAVRGEHLHLGWMRWSNDSGFETCHLVVHEVDDRGRVIYEGRFDDDNFENAYRELERRYCAGEGATFTESTAVGIEWVTAVNRGDFERAFTELNRPDAQFENRSRLAFPDPTVSDPKTSYRDLNAMVASMRAWRSAVCALSPEWGVARIEREAIGRNGEQYSWAWLGVVEVRDGHFAQCCLFDVEDEDAAFAYAEKQMRANTGRLAVTNRAKQTVDAIERAAQTGQLDRVAEWYSPSLVYDDRRRLGGFPVENVREAVEQIAEQYTHLEIRTLAVRGERLHLGWSRYSNDSGFESSGLWVHEVDDDGLIVHQCRFDEDDFEGAYRELARRYSVGEGAAFAEGTLAGTEYLIALNQRDFDRVFDELTHPGMRVENRSRSAFPDRSAAELRATYEELHTMVATMRSWNSAEYWLTPNRGVLRHEREATGQDGERYAWTHLVVFDITDGRCANLTEFDVNDEDAAFAYANERTAPRRLSVNTLAKRAFDAGMRVLQSGDHDAAAASYADGFVYDDRRRLGGNPIDDIRSASESVHAQYNNFEGRTLAVRGEHLHLSWNRWSNDSGFETIYLNVHEFDEQGLVVYEGRFDGDNFEGAYRELEQRYYAGEGSEFAEAGNTVTAYLTAYSQGDFDRMFGELTAADFRLENRSPSAFSDRSAAELRAALEDLSAMFTSVRSWNSVERWISPTWCVGRNEREAIGADGEQFTWTRIYVCEVRDGRIAHTCEFDLDDEEAAFAYAEERACATASRLAVANLASRTWDTIRQAVQFRDFDLLAKCYSPSYVDDDRRRLHGFPMGDPRLAAERVAEQFDDVEMRSLAVRGDRLHLGWTRYTNAAGFESSAFWLVEVDDDGRIHYQARFDEDDFEDAYRELEDRYYAGEGSEFAEAGVVATDFSLAVGQGDLDRLFGQILAPDFHVENRSHSVFSDRSAAEFRAGLEDLMAMVDSARTWNSALCWLSSTCGIARNEREAIGRDGERYEWSDIDVFVIKGGRAVSACMFDLDDEEAAFAYAEERVRAAEGS